MVLQKRRRRTMRRGGASGIWYGFSMDQPIAGQPEVVRGTACQSGGRRRRRATTSKRRRRHMGGGASTAGYSFDFGDSIISGQPALQNYTPGASAVPVVASETGNGGDGIEPASLGLQPGGFGPIMAGGARRRTARRQSKRTKRTKSRKVRRGRGRGRSHSRSRSRK